MQDFRLQGKPHGCGPVLQFLFKIYARNSIETFLLYLSKIILFFRHIAQLKQFFVHDIIFFIQ